MKSISSICISGILILLPFLSVSCGKDDEETTATVNPINAAYEQLVESGPQLTTTSFKVTGESGPGVLAALSNWDNATESVLGVNSSATNPQGFVAGMVDDSVEESIFTKARMPFQIACSMDAIGEKDDNDLFVTGSQTVTFSSASLVGVCGTAAEFEGMLGESMTITVENLTDTTNYDQRIVFPDAGIFSGKEQWVYIRNTSTTLNLLHVEYASDASSITTTAISYDKDSEYGVFQHTAKFSTDVRVYRIVMDKANDDVGVLAYKLGVGGSNPHVTFHAASTFENQDFAALSMTWANQNAPYDTDLTDGNACINTSTAAIETDNTLTCADNSKTALSTATFSAGIGAAAAALSIAGVRADADDQTIAAFLPSFTAGTILSAALGF